MNACWSGCSSPSPFARPSTVVISAPSWATASARHELARTPSIRTVHAPHWPWSQPFLEPVRPMCSRSRSSTVTRVSTSSVCSSPLIRSVTEVSIPESNLQPMSCAAHGRCTYPSAVADELEKAAVGVAEVHARPRSAHAAALDRAELDLDAVLAQMLRGVLDRAVPGPAQVAPAGRDRDARDRRRVDARAVQVELRVAEAVAEPVADRHDLGAQHVAVERVGALPVGDVDDTVVEARRWHAVVA